VAGFLERYVAALSGTGRFRTGGHALSVAYTLAAASDARQDERLLMPSSP